MIVMIFIFSAIVSAEEMSEKDYLQLVQDIQARYAEYTEAIIDGEAPPIKSATPITRYLFQMKPKSLSVTGPYDRRDDLDQTYDTDNFKLHYTLSGVDAVYEPDTQTIVVGVPDYIVRSGDIFEEVWNYIINVVGYTPALYDTGEGGDTRIDVYFCDIITQTGVAAYGFSNPEVYVTSKTAYGFMFLDNDYQDSYPGYTDFPLNAVRVTAAHEFFHLVQFAHDMWEVEGSSSVYSTSWSEMSSTYMEDEIYDNVNDYYGYLPYFYNFPQWSLRRGGYTNNMDYHMYASAVFPIFLVDKFGPSIMREIWEGCASYQGPNWWLAADTAIMDASILTENLQSMFKEFALWNLFTHNWARSGEYFPEASFYDPVYLVAGVNSYPSIVDVDDTLLPDDLGTNYILLENYNPDSDTLAVAFDCDRTKPWSIQVVGMPADPGNVSQSVWVDDREFDSTTTQFLIPDVSEHSFIILIASLNGQPTEPGAFSQPNFARTVPYKIGVAEYSGEGLFSPQADDALYLQVSYNISWYLDETVDSVRIEISSNNGVTWEEIAVLPNLFVYQWTPAGETGEFVMRVSDIGTSGKSVQTNGTFLITGVTEDVVSEPYPNPSWMQIHSGVKFKAIFATGNQDREMKVHIVNLAGEKVREIYGSSTGGQIEVEWDYTNEAGQTVAAGMYLGVVEIGGETVVKKFFVYR